MEARFTLPEPRGKGQPPLAGGTQSCHCPQHSLPSPASFHNSRLALPDPISASLTPDLLQQRGDCGKPKVALPYGCQASRIPTATLSQPQPLCGITPVGMILRMGHKDSPGQLQTTPAMPHSSCHLQHHSSPSLGLHLVLAQPPETSTGIRISL